MNEQISNNMETETKSSGIGGMIGVIIIIVLLIAGGWYFISNRVEKIKEQKTNLSIDISTGASTEIDDIQTDLDNLDLEVLD